MTKYFKGIHFFFILLFIGTIQSQNIKYGKISPTEISDIQKSIVEDTEAVIIYKGHDIKYEYIRNEGFVQFTDVHERIYIHNSNGYEWATKEIGLKMQGKNEEALTDIQGYTYTIINGREVETKLEKTAIFEEKNGKYNKKVKLTLPGIIDGCIIEYKYRIRSPFLGYIERIDLQATIPIKKLEVSLKIPEYFGIRQHFNPRSSISYNIREDSKSRNIHFSDFDNGSFYSRNNSLSQSNVTYQENMYLVTSENIPELPAEELGNFADNYKASLTWEMMFVKPPSGLMTNFSETWEDVAGTIWKSPDFKSNIENSSYFSEDIDAIIKQTPPDINRVNTIYNFLKSKVTWNRYLGYFPDEGTKNAFKLKEGNVADINLMLIAMLRHAGFTADPILVSTIENGIPLFPTMHGFNYIIAGVKVNNNLYLLDATDPYIAFGLLPRRARNWQGILIKENSNSNWIDLSPKVTSENKTTLSYLLSETGDINGKVSTTSNSYKAADLREIFSEMTDTDFVSSQLKEYPGIKVKNIETKNLFEVNKPITLEYTFEAKDIIELIGERIYISPLLFLKTIEEQYKSDIREYPVIYDYPFNTSRTVNVVLPDNYSIESLPESAKIILGDGSGEYKYIVSGEGNRLRIVSELLISKSFFNISEYVHLKEIYNTMYTKENERVVLLKNKE